jgi:hypothetical protein
MAHFVPSLRGVQRRGNPDAAHGCSPLSVHIPHNVDCFVGLWPPRNDGLRRIKSRHCEERSDAAIQTLAVRRFRQSRAARGCRGAAGATSCEAAQAFAHATSSLTTP